MGMSFSAARTSLTPPRFGGRKHRSQNANPRHRGHPASVPEAERDPRVKGHRFQTETSPVRGDYIPPDPCVIM
jgi:hypothetical protein